MSGTAERRRVFGRYYSTEECSEGENDRKEG